MPYHASYALLRAPSCALLADAPCSSCAFALVLWSLVYAPIPLHLVPPDGKVEVSLPFLFAKLSCVLTLHAARPIPLVRSRGGHTALFQLAYCVRMPPVVVQARTCADA